MKRNILSCAVCLSVVMLLASCLKDDDDDNIVYSDDAAIISFTLSDLSRYVTKTASNGTDSTYKVTVAGSSYKMYIDQINHLIYNVDSLPHNTDVSKVLCTVSSKNSGLILIQNIDSDTLKYYSSTDSIDFTRPRKMIAYSYDGSKYQEYTVKLNVHTERNDQFVWNSSEVSLPSDLQGMKALSCNGRVFVFASDGYQTHVMYCDEQGDGQWQLATHNFNGLIPADAYQNIVTRDNHLYMNIYGTIMKSADGIIWEPTAHPNISRLVAAGAKSLYALSDTGLLFASDDEGVTWSVEQLDDSPTLLPTTDISYCCLPSRVNDSTELIVMTGNRSLTDFPADRYAMVWTKVEDYSTGSRHDSWTYTSACDVDSVALPRLSNLTVSACDGAIIAMGAAGIGACEVPAFSQLYYSQDGGIYWLNDNNYQLPKNFEGKNIFAMTVDSLRRIWIITADGKVWKGYYPDTVWEKIQKSFTD